MTFKAFVRQNVVLVVGLVLPIVVMAAFMAASGLQQRLSDPPKQSLVFATTDYSFAAQGFPVVPRFIVRDGVLHAEFTQPPSRRGNEWKKLYLYDAETQKVRQLEFGLPAGAESIDVSREEVVESTKNYTLDTTLQAADGYELSYGGRVDGGFFDEFLWRSRQSYGPRLTRKGGASIRLTVADGQLPYGPGGVEFIGWVTATGAGP